MSRWVLHIDLDEFIAAVEVLRHPELAGLPVVVGGDGDPLKRGVVSTASYAARGFGVRSGMPLRTALKRCPQAVFLAVDKPAYDEASAVVMATLREFDAVVEVIGWDEAWLGVVTDDPEQLARQIAARVLEVTRLHSSVGIGKNKLQAKMATGFGKPRGIYRLTSRNWFELLGDESPKALWGIGSQTAKKLAGLGATTVRELAAMDDTVLADRFGPTIGPWIGRVGRGEDPSPVVGDPWIRRSRSREITFQQDLADWDEIRAEVARLTAQVIEDLAADGREVGRVGIKVRWVPFTTVNRVRKLKTPTLDGALIEEVALDVLESVPPRLDGTRGKVRLLGVRLEFA